MGNEIMRRAQRNKKDEFYTQTEDIEKELPLYKGQFQRKTVFLPCDSIGSNFTKFFKTVFEEWCIKKAYALHWNGEGTPATLVTISYDSVTSVPLIDDDGDLRSSATFRQLLSKSDIIVTNPPFSLFRQFMTTLIKSGKNFIVLGNMNQILTKDLFQYVASDKLWWGPSIYSGDRTFRVPVDYPLEASGTSVDENGNKYIRVKGVRWFTNMRPDPENATVSRAIVPTVRYSDMTYDRFDYMPDIICINRTEDIPYDYDGIMGVPLTYFDRHNPELFEIIDGVNRYLVLDKLGISEEAKKNHWHLLTVNGKVKYFRILIKRKK